MSNMLYKADGLYYIFICSLFVVFMGQERNVYRVLMEKPERKRPLGRPRRRWNGIKMDLMEIGWGSVD
jgi:hypothetical protein